MSQPSFEQDPSEFKQDANEMAPVGGAPVAPQYRKQGFSIYSVMLIGSFVFLLTAMIFLFIEAGRYQ